MHDVECAGRKGSITGNHAYHAGRMARRRIPTARSQGVTEVVAVETDTYREDVRFSSQDWRLRHGRRGIGEWRPHSFENGRRLRCTLKGTWRDRVLQRLDSRQ